MGKHKKDKSVKGFRLNPISEGGDDGKGSSTTSTGRSSLGDQLIADRVMDPSMAKLRNKARCNKVEDEPEVSTTSTYKIIQCVNVLFLSKKDRIITNSGPFFHSL